MKRLGCAALGGLLMVTMLAARADEPAPMVYFKVGDDLIASCKGTAAGEDNASTAEYLLCLGYLQGVVDTDATLAEWIEGYPRQACVPQGTTSSMLRQILLEWLDSRPDYLKYSAASLALTAYEEAWPCKLE